MTAALQNINLSAGTPTAPSSADDAPLDHSELMKLERLEPQLASDMKGCVPQVRVEQFVAHLANGDLAVVQAYHVHQTTWVNGMNNHTCVSLPQALFGRSTT